MRQRAVNRVPRTGRVTASNRVINSRSGIVAASPAPAPSVFDRTTIANLKSFYQADGQTAGVAATWNDTSGNAKHATAGGSPTVVANVAAFNNRDVMRFSGVTGTSDYFTLPDLGVSTQVDIFMVAKFVENVPTVTENGGVLHFGTDVSLDGVWTGDGNFYCGVGSTVRRVVGGGVALGMSNLHLYRFHSSAGSWFMEVDGTPQYSTAVNTFGMPAAPEIGRGTLGATWFMRADMGEFMVVSGLAAQDLISYEAQVASDYAITIPANAAWSRTDIANLKALYTAEGMSAGVAATWPDTSGNTKHGTGVNSPTVVASVAAFNNRNVMRFTGASGTSDHFTLPDLSVATSCDIFAVMKLDADPQASEFDGGLFEFGTAGAGLPDLLYTPDSHLYIGAGSTVRKDVGDPTPSLASVHLVRIHSSAGSFFIEIDGTQVYSTGTNTFDFNASPKIGQSSNPAYCLKGDIAELMVVQGISPSDLASYEAQVESEYNITI